MRKTICTIALTALAGGALLMAQSPTQTQPKPMPPAQEEAKLTGCLKPAGAAHGMAGAMNTDAKFILEVMPPHAGMPSENRGPDGTRMSPADAARAAGAESQTYRLVAKAGVDLTKHVNHTVELTGAKARVGDSEEATATGGADSMHKATLPLFNVTELRMVSASCTATQN